MTTKLTFHKHLSLLLLALLTACGTATPSSASTVDPVTQLANVKTIAAATISIQQTQIAIDLTTTPQPPTKTPNGTPTRWSVQFSPTPTITPTPAPPQPFPLDGYVMVFLKDGNLYFQDENNTPIQLTRGGDEIHSLKLSDDNQKVVFSKGKVSNNWGIYSNIYSVNVDGSNEQALITPQWLARYGKGVGVISWTFVPKTHQVSFILLVCGNEKKSSDCATNGVFIVDTDTGEIKKLVSPDSVGTHTISSVALSPNGEMIAIAMAGSIDVLNINGEMLIEDVFSYTSSTPVKLSPEINWLPDSSGMIVVLPTTPYYGIGYETYPSYTVWRYILHEPKAIQLYFEPSPTLTFAECAPAIYFSPDRKWGLYNPSRNVNSLYIWDLDKGTAQIYDSYSPCSNPSWSPDNKHFFYRGDHSQDFLGSIGKAPVSFREGIEPTWIDATHFTYVVLSENETRYRLFIAALSGDTIQRYERPEAFLLLRPKR